eukprot:273897-Rhodomonas_salina.1
MEVSCSCATHALCYCATHALVRIVLKWRLRVFDFGGKLHCKCGLLCWISGGMLSFGLRAERSCDIA